MARSVSIIWMLLLTIPLGYGQEAPLFKSEANLVPIEVQVLDRDTRQPIAGLVREDFVVLDEDNPTELRLFDADRAPLNVVLAIDLSGGFTNEGILYVTDAFLRLRQPDDRMALISFANGDTHRRTGLTDSEKQIVDARRIIFGTDRNNLGGSPKNSRLYDAVREGIRTLSQESTRPRRPVIVAITHNREARSSVKKSPLIAALLDSGITLEAITIPQEVATLSITPSFSIRGMPSKRRPRTPPAPEFLDDLHSIEEVVQAAGGSTIPLNYKNARRATDPALTGRTWNSEEISLFLESEIMARLRAQYTLGIYNPSLKERRYHRLEVRLSEAATQKHPNAVVHARAGYYAGPPDAKGR